MKEKIIENGIEYVRRGDYYYPKRGGIKETIRQLGAYGRLHKEFIKNYRKGFYSSLILQGKLDEYLYELNREAYRMLNELIDYFAENEGVTEELKKENQMEWVRRMNNIKARAEEIVLDEIVYTTR